MDRSAKPDPNRRIAKYKTKLFKNIDENWQYSGQSYWQAVEKVIRHTGECRCPESPGVHNVNELLYASLRWHDENGWLQVFRYSLPCDPTTPSLTARKGCYFRTQAPLSFWYHHPLAALPIQVLAKVVRTSFSHSGWPLARAISL